MVVVREDLTRPGGSVPPGVVVEVRLVGPNRKPVTGYAPGRTILDTDVLRPDIVSGVWQLDLPPNDDITPAGTRWLRTVKRDAVVLSDPQTALVPDVAGPVDWADHLSDPPASIPSPALSVHEADPTAHGVDVLDSRLDTAEADINAAEAALTAHEARRTIDGASGGVHGVIEHRWERDGWAPFGRKVVNQDGGQVIGLSVSGDQGLFTGTVAGPGNQRELYVHEDTLDWSAGEVTALIGRPSTYVHSVNSPQSGVVLGYQLISGFHTALVVWYDVFVGDPSIHNIAGWRGNGGTTLGQATGGNYVAEIARTIRVLQVERFAFLGWINGYVCQPYHLHGLATGDVVDITVNGDATFTETNIAVAGVDRNTGVVQVSDPVHTGAVALKVSDGTITHDAGHKRWFPYWLKARRIGAVVSMKAWRTTEAEPDDWQATVTVTTDGDFPVMPGAGGYGLVGAHVHSGSFGRYGPVTIRRLG